MSPQARPTADELVTSYSAHIKGKVVLTTGISQNSLGAYFVEAIAKASPALIILAGRSAPKSQETADKVRSANPAVQTRFLQVDLGSFKSVRAAAGVLNGWDDVPVVDVVVNNAFVWSNGYQLTVDGVETQLATNHLGHFLLTNLIMDKILASSAPRVVNVSSEGHRVSPVRFGDYNFDGGKTYTDLRAYAQSKTANMLFSVSLAEKLGPGKAKKGPGLLSFSLHPGEILTNAAPHMDFKTIGEEMREAYQRYGDRDGFVEPSSYEFQTVAQGTATHVVAAFSPDIADHNGSYLINARVSDPLTDPVRPWGYSPFEAEKLWRLSEELVGHQFSY
ncbi:hypothetical protein CVT26_011274 [Gymnopilus dilepis]|uniref:Uncharacterized protein n=1 Tax=Gymnopilus dilepis TaxID=231916 RepID=A0A409VJI1_9AGAR|nr:hypothetical protein CVT26_011274 [Gymnopilus dilepis]